MRKDLCDKKSGGCGKFTQLCACGCLMAHPWDCACVACRKLEEKIRSGKN